MSNRPRRLVETLTAIAVATLLCAYGWIVLLDESVTLQAKGRTASFSGNAAAGFAGAVFLCAALFVFFAAKTLRYSAPSRWIAATVIVLAPALYLAFQ